MSSVADIARGGMEVRKFFPKFSSADSLGLIGVSETMEQIGAFASRVNREGMELTISDIVRRFDAAKLWLGPSGYPCIREENKVKAENETK